MKNKRSVKTTEENKIKPKVIFKFTLFKDEHPDLITYILGIKNKNKRREWLVNAVRLYKDLEVSLGLADFDYILQFIENCKKKTK